MYKERKYFYRSMEKMKKNRFMKIPSYYFIYYCSILIGIFAFAVIDNSNSTPRISAPMSSIFSSVINGASSMMSLETEFHESPYEFPVSKLDIERLKEPPLDDSGLEREPVVLVACGSFSPVTNLHLRMFEMAKDRLLESKRFFLVGGYFSPTNDKYNKTGLAQGHHRVKMCEIAVEGSPIVMVDSWEVRKPTFQRSVFVLEHFQNELDAYLKSLNINRKIRVMMLAGGDLIESFGSPNVWSDEDLEIILGKFGCLCVERAGSDLKGFLLAHDIAYKHKDNIMIVKQHIHNDISSTKIRLFIKRGMSIKYLLPDEVIQYIEMHQIFPRS